MERSTVPTLLLWSTVLFALIAGAVSGIGLADGATASPTPDGANTTYAGTVDPALRVVEYSVQDGDLVIEFEADVPKTVTIAEPPETSGASSFRVKEVPIPSGRSTVTFPVTEVMITTPACIQAGSCYAIDESGPLIGGPWTARDAQIAATTTAGTVGLIAVVLTLRTLHGRRHDPERVA